MLLTARLRRLDLLASRGFCTALALLLLNDFVLKAWFATWWTGKLSDVAGLAAFALFWTACFPRVRRVVFSLIGLGFILWKSPLITPALMWWNQFDVWPLSRVIDPTDYVALGILPIAFAYTSRYLQCPPRPVMPTVRLALILCALFAFTATSRRVTVKDGTQYIIHAPPDAVHRGLVDLGYRLEPEADGQYRNPLEIYLEYPDVTVLLSVISIDSRQTQITLLEFHGSNTAPSQEIVRGMFELQVISPLRSHIAGISAIPPVPSVSEKRCLTIRFKGWSPTPPKPSRVDPHWYTMPRDLAMATGFMLFYRPFAPRLMPPLVQDWQPLILAPPLPASNPPAPPDNTPERLRHRDSYQFLDVWAKPTSDSILFFGAAIDAGLVQSTLTVEGRWVADTMQGTALWQEYHNESSGTTSTAYVVSVRYVSGYGRRCGGSANCAPSTLWILISFYTMSNYSQIIACSPCRKATNLFVLFIDTSPSNNDGSHCIPRASSG